MKNLAQLNLAPNGGFKGFGPLGDPKGTDGINIFSKFISSAVGLMTIIAIIWFVFSFITGAIGILASGGDKQALENAKKKITTGIVGLIVVILAIFIIRLIGFLLGLPDILNISTLFGLIQIKP
ncbi:MAG TPA: hypothetical protein VL401_00025 [Alphaproteobacteria bacterium]|jgi:hypothetical protein|nr:hypothetical protein [Alphaproteobacteria bacterium]